MSELTSGSEPQSPRGQELTIEPITVEEFIRTQDQALNRLMDGLDLDYRDGIRATSRTTFMGMDSYLAELESGYTMAPYNSELMILDKKSSGEMVGYGFVTFFNNGVARVGDTFTDEDHRRQGLGRRRLYLMNMLTNQLRGQVLYSGISIEPEAQSLWLRLVDEGVAEAYCTQRGLTRWRFKKEAT